MIIVAQPGPLALLQDQGRPQCAHLGVSPSGAADRTAFALANRLVGNPDHAAAIETTLGGLEISVGGQVLWVTVTGAPTQVVVNGVPTASHTTIVLRPGDRLRIDPPPYGLRNYLAVRGGIEGLLVLGSRSTDVLSGLGPPALRAGQELPIGSPRHALPDIALAPPHQPSKSLDLLPGPRRDWFSPDAWQSLLDQPWTVTAEADRVAVRLTGPELRRTNEAELGSEGLIRGAVQVPTSGAPLIFGADHPVTGGYPVIGVLTARAADHAAQLRPGDTVRFRAPGGYAGPDH